MDFNNLEIAFKDKSNSDLNRAFILFKIINNRLISKILTSIVKFCLWLRIPINPFIRSTVFKHFCGGTTISNSQKTIDLLWNSNIGTILDYSAEGKKTPDDFNHVMKEIIQTIEKSETKKSIPFTVFKFTGLTNFSLLEKISLNLKLTEEEEKEKKEFENRVYIICKTASEKKVPIFIDAEESWIQNTIDELTVKMMMKFNKKACWIYNTLQMYRNDRLKYLNEMISYAYKKDFLLGFKIVRGAYHEQEIERSKLEGYVCFHWPLE